MTHKINILIDGSDNTGKTSVITELSKVFKPAMLIQQLRGFNKKYGKTESYAVGKLLNSTVGIISDRTYLSEHIYSPIMRNYKPAYARALEANLADHNFLFIFHTNKKATKKYYDGNFISLEQNIRLNELYIEEFNNILISNKFLIDTSEMTIAQIVDKIRSIVDERY